jgi:hypothetical protein
MSLTHLGTIAELERLYRRTTSLQDFVASASAARDMHAAASRVPVASRQEPFYGRNEHPQTQYEQNAAGLVSRAVPDSSDPMWAVELEHSGTGNGRGGSRFQVDSNGRVPSTSDGTEAAEGAEQTAVPLPRLDGTEAGPESLPSLPADVIWGPLVFEARRFVELRKKTFSGK